MNLYEEQLENAQYEIGTSVTIIRNIKVTNPELYRKLGENFTVRCFRCNNI